MIQGNLEYLMCSLPYLAFQDTVEERTRVVSIFEKYAQSMGEEQSILSIFEEEAGKFLTTDKWQVLREIRLEDIHGPYFQRSKNKLIAAFAFSAYRLKKDIRHLRLARKNNLEAPEQKRPLLPLMQGNPLEVEIELMKWQWEMLEDLSIGHYADFSALCAYSLKLQLLLRCWGFNRKRGFEVFLEITEIN